MTRKSLRTKRIFSIILSLAVALTMLFTVVVCFAMRRHVRHISMVESMKAPE